MFFLHIKQLTVKKIYLVIRLPFASFLKISFIIYEQFLIKFTVEE